MKDWTPILLTGGILLLIWIFAPRLLDILEKRTIQPAGVNDLVKAIELANAKAEIVAAKAAEAKALSDKAVAEKAAADAAAKNNTP